MEKLFKIIFAPESRGKILGEFYLSPACLYLEGKVSSFFKSSEGFPESNGKRNLDL